MSWFPGKIVGSDESYVSPVVDPFNRDGFESMAIFVRRGSVDRGTISYRAHVEFKVGDTEGKQTFSTNDFDSLLAVVRTFIRNLKP